MDTSSHPSIFLSGSNGFIGKNIVADFAPKYTLYSPTRKELELCNAEAVESYFNKHRDIGCIIHGANIGGMRNSVITDESCLYANISAFMNVYQQYKSHGSTIQKFIQLGSGAEYARPTSKPAIKECEVGQILPKDAYGISKFMCGNVIENDSDNNSVNLRIFGMFGPYEDYQVRFISSAIVRSLFDLPIIVNQNASFDYLYINDFLKILKYFIESTPEYHSYNITPGQPVTMIELAQIIKRLTNNRHEIVVKNPVINQIYTGCNKRLLEFLPASFKFTDISVAIEELIKWYQVNIQLIDEQKVINSG